MNEMTRLLIEMAVKSGRKRQSQQTGYLHYCYQAMEEEQHDPIPLVENMLFALALLRSRTTENILEAKALIENLLHFQIQSGPNAGNFPKYLHEYPACKQRLLGANALPPLYWSLKLFHQVLGNELKNRLETSLKALVNYSLTSLKEKPAPYQVTMKIAAAAKIAGQLLNESAIESAGDHLLTELSAVKYPEAWFSPNSMADILTALQMLYPSIQQSPWKDFWAYLEKTWHPSTDGYIGPAINDFQLGYQPQPTLYDLYMSYFSKTLPKRLLGDHLYHLHACLIQPTEEHLSLPNIPLTYVGSCDRGPWLVQQNQRYAYSTFEYSESLDPSDKSLNPFKLVWGDCNHAHTFVCQGTATKQMTYRANENSIDLFFVLAGALEGDDKEKSREIAFYFDMQEQLQMLVKEVPSSTFLLGDEVKILSKDLSFSITFTLKEGEGRFFGHIMPGNRPAQLANRGPNTHKAYDWQIFLRTLQRSDRVCLKATIKIL